MGTAKKQFTKEEIEILAKNVNVESVTGNQIRFTAGFKRVAYEGLRSGKPMAETFSENGLDPEIIGMGRIHSFTNNLKKRAERGDGFKDARSSNGKKPRPREPKTADERIRDLESEVKNPRGQVDALTEGFKIFMQADTFWNSKKNRGPRSS